MVLQKVWIYRLNTVGHRLIIRKNKKINDPPKGIDAQIDCGGRWVNNT